MRVISRKRRLGIALGFFSVVLALLVLDYAFYPWNAPMPGRVSGNRGENGLWLGDTWYFGQHSSAEITELAQDLEKRQVRYAYFHVRYIGKSGNLRYRYPDAASRFNATLRRANPNLKSIAWIYVGNTRGSGSITDLGDPQLRHRMVAEARFLVTQCGFDGVQWDYEICSAGDHGLLDLLAETRADLPPGKTLSVATALLAPATLTRRLGYGWSDAYFGEIALRCDQIAVMGYDSGLYLPRAYAWLMAEQVDRICPAVRMANPNCRVVIGVPTYEAGGRITRTRRVCRMPYAASARATNASRPPTKLSLPESPRSPTIPPTPASGRRTTEIGLGASGEHHVEWAS